MKLASSKREIELNSTPLVIGERINPTGKPRLAQALREGNFALIASEAIEQERAGAHLLDINAGVAGINEPEALAAAVKAVSEACPLPLVIDSSNPEALKAALAVYEGRALINSVNASRASLERVLPLAAESNACLVCLALDEDGVPATAEKRLALAEKIMKAAESFGIASERLICDPLTTAVCADESGALTTLEALRLVKRELGIATLLGVSNISFGLPGREEMNAAFLTLALQAGLDAAILNPLSKRMMHAYRAFLALTNRDEYCLGYTQAFMDE